MITPIITPKTDIFKASCFASSSSPAPILFPINIAEADAIPIPNILNTLFIVFAICIVAVAFVPNFE